MDSKKISELRDILDNSSYVIQKNISSSTVDQDIQLLLDSIAQQTHYVLSAIIESLEEQ